MGSLSVKSEDGPDGAEDSRGKKHEIIFLGEL
jgi:hypothetical protein